MLLIGVSVTRNRNELHHEKTCAESVVRVEELHPGEGGPGLKKVSRAKLMLYAALKTVVVTVKSCHQAKSIQIHEYTIAPDRPQTRGLSLRPQYWMRHVHSFLITSENPVKISAASNGLDMVMENQEYQLESRNVQPGNFMPMGRETTFNLALERIQMSRESIPGFDVYLSLEGGLDAFQGRSYVFAWCIAHEDARDLTTSAESAKFEIPFWIYQSLLDDPELELGTVIDRLSGANNSKQAGGAVGLFTNGVITRTLMLTHPVVLAVSGLRPDNVVSNTLDRPEWAKQPASQT